MERKQPESEPKKRLRCLRCFRFFLTTVGIRICPKCEKKGGRDGYSEKVYRPSPQDGMIR